MTRWAPLSGIIFVALWIPGFAILLANNAGESDADIVSFYAKDDGRGKVVMAFFLMLAASLFFAWFLTVLRERLARAEGRQGALTALSFGAGLVAMALWLVASVLWLSVSYTADQDDRFKVDPNTERLVSETAYLFFVTGSIVALLVVLGTSLVARRTSLLPAWLAWLGFLVAVTMLGSLAVVPFFVFLGWVVVVCVTLIVRAEPADDVATI